jgi:hypothetical protein
MAKRASRSANLIAVCCLCTMHTVADRFYLRRCGGHRSTAFDCLGKLFEVTWELGTAFGLCVLQGPCEAEALCCALALYGTVDAVMTSDSDAVVYGAPLVCSYVGVGEACSNVCTAVGVQQHLGVQLGGRKAMQFLAGAAGCDYGTGISGIGVTKAVRWVVALLKGSEVSVATKYVECTADQIRR